MSCQENCGAVLSVAGSLLVQVTVAVVSCRMPTSLLLCLCPHNYCPVTASMSCQENCGAVLSVPGSLLVQVTVAVVSMSHGHLIENCGAVLSVPGSLLVQVTVAVVSCRMPTSL
ncbi:hypothetical protein J6590_005853 [Homalodisca vitripennis]|nr:hypothetical protein J6590_005853 [Homalodisca vitripennis]